MKKRLLSLTLALVMALALLPAAAFAADSDFVIVDGVLETYTGPGGDVVVPEGVYWIKEKAFRTDGGYKITSVVLPEGLIALGGYYGGDRSGMGTYTSSNAEGIFWRFPKLTSVTFPSTLMYMDMNTFMDCDALETITFPAECKEPLSFGWFTFSDCKNLKTVTLPKGKITLGASCFSGCSALEKVTFAPGGEYKLEAGAFIGCKSLTTLENAETIVEMAPDSFSYCRNLENMTFSDQLDPAVLGQFGETPWFQKKYAGEEFVVQNGALIRYNGPGGDVVIPDDLGITSIGKAGFQEVTSIVIPEGVTEIGEKAFVLCEKLENVTLPSSLRLIKKGAFYACTALNDVVLPEDVTVLGDAFTGCKNLSRITIPKTAVFPGADTFRWHFKEAPVEESLAEAQKDSEFVMLGATLLKYQGPGGDVVIPEWTKCVDPAAFKNNPFITSVTYPKAVQEWYDEHSDYKGVYYWSPSWFDGCSRLREFVNAPIKSGESGEYWWERYQKLWSQFKLYVDPAKCLGTPSDRISAQSNAIVAEAGAVTDYDKARAIADWVAKNVKYDWEVYQKSKSANNAVIDPEQILNGAVTVCDGYTQLTNQLLWAQGIPANKIVGRGNGTDHSWTEAWIKDENRWVIIDTTWMAPFMNGTQEQGYEPKYFDMGVVEFSFDHIMTDRPYAEAAPTLTAYTSTQSVQVDGKAVTFQCYALKDASGNDTNYIKLRDVASVLNGTAVQFNVGWDGAVNIETGKGYTPNGSEMNTPFSGNRAYENATAETRINGSRAALDAIVLKDDAGGAYTYYKLRDLGAALGFRVDWSAEKGIFIETK